MIIGNSYSYMKSECVEHVNNIPLINYNEWSTSCAQYYN